jgi:RNA-directed DNA polymerase
VVQTAAKLVLEPIFEADFEDSAYGYRPARGAIIDAVKEVHRLIGRGYTDVVDADLSKYFDTIPHSELMKSVACRIADGAVLRLIKLWLKAPIEERDGNGKRRMSGGKSNARGTPQGGVASPLLANIYMNRFLKHWRLTERGKAFRARVVAYADDFVILSRGCADEALAWTKAVMTRIGLTLNEAKTSLKNARRERFDFLGYSFGPYCYKGNGRWYLSAGVSKKSVQRLKAKVGNLLTPGNLDPWLDVRDALNAFLFGWARYFSYGTHRAAFRGIDYYVYERMRDFLHAAAQGERARNTSVLLQCCVWEMRCAAAGTATLVPCAVCLTAKPVGEPDAGNRHVRFDERGWETERCRMAQATAPILDSTFPAVVVDASEG